MDAARIKKKSQVSHFLSAMRLILELIIQRRMTLIIMLESALNSGTKTWLKLCLCCCLSLGMLIGGAFTSKAEARVSLVRDAQTEALIRAYARPILKASGLKSGAVEILLVNDKSFNAFVTGRRMFINTGAIIRSEVPNEIIGVIAHETGHIIGGHQTRLRQRLETARVVSVLSGLVGAGVTIGSVASGNREGAAAGQGIALGGQEAALRSVLSYQRSEERAADIAALRLLNATGQSGRGLLSTFERFQSNLLLSGSRPDKYRISHPLPRERLAALSQDVQASPHFTKRDSDGLQLAHDLVRAKLVAYTGNTRERVQFETKFRGTLPGLYAQAISTFLHRSPRQSLPLFDQLIQKAPKNAYFHEMKAEVLLRSAKPREAAAAFKKAVATDRNNNSLLKTQLGHALVEIGDTASLQEAVNVMTPALRPGSADASGFDYLARAHAGLGNEAMASLAASEAAHIRGDKRSAVRFALRAQKSLPNGSAAWLRAGDIINRN